MAPTATSERLLVSAPVEALFFGDSDPKGRGTHFIFDGFVSVSHWCVPMVDRKRGERLEKLNKTIEAQKAFLHRVPDPDTRERAEGHLHALVDMRDAVVVQIDSADKKSD